jgi:DNA-binding transcriptional ArsR family regulator
MDAIVIAAVASALSDATRVRVLTLSDGRHAIIDMAATLNVSSSDVSYHVGRLAEVGLVEVVRRGRRHHPRRVPGAWERVTRALGP